MEAIETLKLAAGLMFWGLADLFLVMIWAGVLLIVIGRIIKWLMN